MEESTPSMLALERFSGFVKKFLLVLGAFAILPVLLVRGLLDEIRKKEGIGSRAWTLAKAAPRIAYLTAVWGALVYGIVFGFAHLLLSR